jgi:hypothetical protein
MENITGQLEPPPKVPHADIGLHCLYKNDKTKLEIVTFGLSNCGIILCGSCRDVVDVRGKTLKDAGNTLIQHLAKRQNDKHPTGISSTEFQAFAISQIDGNSKISTCGVVLFEEIFEWEPLRSLYDGIQKKKIEICSQCFLQKKQQSVCCLGGHEVPVMAYCQPYYTSIPVMSKQELCIFLDQRRLGRTELVTPQLLSPTPSQPSIPRG